jgi:hypothetical protein
MPALKQNGHLKIKAFAIWPIMVLLLSAKGKSDKKTKDLSLFLKRQLTERILFARHVFIL